MNRKPRRNTICHLPTPQERRFVDAVVASSDYEKAKNELFQFWTSQEWAGLKGESAGNIRETVHQALRTNTTSILFAAWTIVGPKVEKATFVMEKLEETRQRLKDGQRAYLQELTQLKDQLRALKGNAATDTDFNEDLEFFDAVQFFDDADKQLIKLIVADKVKTAISRVASGKFDGLDTRATDIENAAQEELETKKKEIVLLRGMLEESQQQYTAERCKNAELESEMTRMTCAFESQLADLEKQVVQLTEEKNGLEEAKLELEILLKEEREKSAEMLEKNRELELEVDMLKEDVQRGQEALMAAQVELAGCQEQLKEASAAAEKIEEEKRLVEEAAAAAAAASAAREEELNARIEELSNLVAELRAMLDQLKKQVADQKKQLAEEKAKREEADVLLKAARKALELAQKQTEELGNENAKLQKRLNDAEIRLANLQDGIQNMRSQGAEAGVGSQIEELLEKTGLKAKKGAEIRNVFSRLYNDALERLARLEAHRLDILRVQRETLLKVLAARNTVSDMSTSDLKASLHSSPWNPGLDRMNLGSKSLPMVGAQSMFDAKAKFSQELYPIMDRHKLEPIDKKIWDLKRQFGGSMGYA